MLRVWNAVLFRQMACRGGRAVEQLAMSQHRIGGPLTVTLRLATDCSLPSFVCPVPSWPRRAINSLRPCARVSAIYNNNKKNSVRCACVRPRPTRVITFPAGDFISLLFCRSFNFPHRFYNDIIIISISCCDIYLVFLTCNGTVERKQFFNTTRSCHMVMISSNYYNIKYYFFPNKSIDLGLAFIFSIFFLNCRLCDGILMLEERRMPPRRQCVPQSNL